MTIARKYSRKMTVFRFPSLCDILILTFLRDRFWPFEHEADSYPQSFVARDKRRFPSLQFPGKNPWGRTPIGLTLGHVDYCSGQSLCVREGVKVSQRERGTEHRHDHWRNCSELARHPSLYLLQYLTPESLYFFIIVSAIVFVVKVNMYKVSGTLLAHRE